MVEAVLPRFPQVHLVLSLVKLPALFDEPEHFQGDFLVLVAEPCEEVGEYVGLVVTLVGHAEQPVCHRLEPEPPHCWMSVKAERRHVVHGGYRFVKRLDRYTVRILPRHEDLYDIVIRLPHAAGEHRGERAEGHDPQFRMVVRQARGEGAPEGLREVQQYLVVVVTKRNHRLASERLHLMEWVHSLRAQEPCGLVHIRIYLSLVASPDECGDEARQLKPDLLALLDGRCNFARLLLGFRPHRLRQMGHAFKVLAPEARDERREDIRQRRRQVGRVLYQTPQYPHAEFPALLRLILHALQQWLQKRVHHGVEDISGQRIRLADEQPLQLL
mmetsp:Transcript_119395/g.337798  ORF Transcript_119395/g.337798 Transcript_119395/m.337798 type:complete len:329 (+) Transcript_119395:540-1526(+)